jgi:hypothetical protein
MEDENVDLKLRYQNRFYDEDNRIEIEYPVKAYTSITAEYQIGIGRFIIHFSVPPRRSISILNYIMNLQGGSRPKLEHTMKNYLLQDFGKSIRFTYDVNILFTSSMLYLFEFNDLFGLVDKTLLEM